MVKEKWCWQVSQLDFKTSEFLSSKFKCAKVIYAYIDIDTHIYKHYQHGIRVSISLLFDLPLRSNKLHSTGQFPILLTMVMADRTFRYSSLEALMMQRFVMGFTYLTRHKPQVQLGNNDGIISSKISIRIQQNFHNHVPI